MTTVIVRTGANAVRVEQFPLDNKRHPKIGGKWQKRVIVPPNSEHEFTGLEHFDVCVRELDEGVEHTQAIVEGDPHGGPPKPPGKP